MTHIRPNLIFDFDGTLIDSSFAILESYSITMYESGIEPKVPIDLNLIGPSLLDSLRKLAGTEDPNIIQHMSNIFKNYYDNAAYTKTKIYPGVANALEKIFSVGKPMYIVTNKRVVPTQKILELFKWEQFFFGVYGIDSFQSNFNEKTGTLKSMVSKHKIDCSKSWYVGDRSDDGIAAKENRVKFAFVDWGFGRMEEFAGIPINKIVTSPNQLNMLQIT